jgi:type II secretory pathway pseudopilin PulG
MKIPTSSKRFGFSLIETVIAIGVLAVLLSGFMIVFAPASAGIRKSLNSQDAARMVSTLEEELVTMRVTDKTKPGYYPTGFDKAFDCILNSGGSDSTKALLIYKYRGSLATASIRADGTPAPIKSVTGQVPGTDYVVQNMMRRLDDPEFLTSSPNDLEACEGPIYLVKCRQLNLDNTGKMTVGKPGEILTPATSTTAAAAVTTPDKYLSAVIPFVADFYALPTKTQGYFTGAKFKADFTKAVDPLKPTKPTFSRNLAVRR